MGARRGFIIVWILLWVGLSLPSEIWAGEPADEIQEAVNQVIDILKDPDLKSQPKVREEKIWEVASPRFDFEEMSRRALAVHWKERTAEERKEFVDLFSRLLHRSYVNKIMDYTDQTVEIVGEKVEAPRAEVSTLLKSQDNEIRIDYRMIQKAPGWFIYDVLVEDVSLVNNYRTQFNDIMISSGYSKLVERLRTKPEVFDKESKKEAKT